MRQVFGMVADRVLGWVTHAPPKPGLQRSE
jgi:hypothetical protein